ncbi:TonB-dependent receptor [Reichenbachiella versicolor]|uniref:TonB-dependent receptor n=1 Tax=Reichenbachiella versicolor TaxID=1821036 RepID=UPI0013A54E2A|nr:TonB-dependent receptor [Reichenbachiella versicolor]
MSGQSTVRGVILDESGKPFAGANLLLNSSKRTVSSTEGKFVFNDVRARKFEIKVSAIGFEDISVQGTTDTLTQALSIILTPSVQELEGVTINGNAQEELKRVESISKLQVDKKFLLESKGASLMQSLNAIPGVNSMDIGTGISKPMIRGMGYYRVVVAQNGIRQEGQQWSSHHGLSIDQQAVGHVEIIKGPASLEFGSGAIGGVINVLPERVPSTDGLTGELSMVTKSNTQWFGGSAELSFRKRDFYSHIDITYNSFGDFQIPETESFLLPVPVSASEASHEVVLGDQVYNTAGEEKAISLTTGIVKPWGRSSLILNYYATKVGFFDWQGIQNDSIRIIHDQSRRDLQLPYQEVNNYTIQHITSRYFNNDELEIGIGYQFNDSKEYSYLTDRTGNREEDLNHYTNKGNLNLGLFLHTISTNVVYSFNQSEKHSFKFGLNTQFQIHTNDGYNHILPNYNRYAGGIFLTHKYTIADQWILNSGARIDFTYLNIEETLNPDVEFGDPVFNPALEETYPGSAYSIGVNFLPSRTTIIKVNIGKSFRVPSVYELAAYGLHRHGGRFEKGNIENEPEQAWEFDLGIEQKWSDFSIGLSPFINYFTNYLYLNPSSELRPVGQVFEYRQSRASLLGGEITANYLYRKKLNLSVNAEYVYAVNLDLKSALPFTPPLNLRTELSYLFNDLKPLQQNKLGIELLTVASQNNTVPNELSTSGYNSINLLGRTEILFGSQRINLMLKVRNLLNASYYNHISFYRRMWIPEPGRDIQLYISVPIK